MIHYTSMEVTKIFYKKFDLLTYEQKREIFRLMELIWESMNQEENTPPIDYPQILGLDDPGLFYFQVGKYFVTFQLDGQTILFADIVTRRELWRK